MLLELQHVIKRFHDRELLHIPLWQIHQGQRIGLIGANGSGKTTLLRILQGACEVEEGVVRRFCTLSYFEQLSQEVSYGDGKLMKELSVSRLQAQKHVSGGEQQRLRLSNVLSTACHLYLLDEPTSNLDQQGIAFVKKALQNMDTFVLVTHERSLLQEVCNQIIEIKDGRLHIYEGNYESYLQQTEEKRKYLQHRYDTIEKQRHQLQKAYEQKLKQAQKAKRKPRNVSNSERKMRGKVALRKSKDGISKAMYRQADAIASRMEHLERVEVIKEEEAIAMDVQALDLPKGKWLLKAEGLCVSYGDHDVLKDVRFFMKNHSRVALVGENGCGKTTLLNAIVQGNPAIWKAPKVKIGRLFQQFENLKDEQSVYENAMADSVQCEAIVRTVLDRLLFQQQDLKKPVAVLSGGERMRLGFAKLMIGASNLLLLDEPTNYLDLPSIRCITALLQHYEGSVLFVSHDAAFIREVATEVWQLREHTLSMPQDRVKQRKSKQERGDPDIATKRMLLDMRRSEIALQLMCATADREALEKEYDEILEKLKNL